MFQNSDNSLSIKTFIHVSHLAHPHSNEIEELPCYDIHPVITIREICVIHTNYIWARFCRGNDAFNAFSFKKIRASVYWVGMRNRFSLFEYLHQRKKSKTYKFNDNFNLIVFCYIMMIIIFKRLKDSLCLQILFLT